MKSKEFWGDPDNAKAWVRRANLKRKAGDDSDKIVIKKIKDKFNTVLEVGAGNGRIIGGLADIYPEVECYSIDINPGLSEYVSDKYPSVHVESGGHEITKLPFGDNEFDMVYTFQVLQHIPPEDIEQALSELQRVAKKELWLFEGYGNLEKWKLPNGHMRHKGDGGTFYWDFEKMLNCRSVNWLNRLKKGEERDTGIKHYKIKIKKQK